MAVLASAKRDSPHYKAQYCSPRVCGHGEFSHLEYPQWLLKTSFLCGLHSALRHARHGQSSPSRVGPEEAKQTKDMVERCCLELP